MRVDNYKEPKSSFLSLEKDLSILVKRIMANDNVKKMLYYTDKDCLRKPKLNDEQSAELFGKNIKIIPKLYVDEKVLNYVFITFDNFKRNNTNPEFRDSIVQIDVICHFSQWDLSDFKLRPYRIAAEIDAMLDKERFTGIGKLEFVTGVEIIASDEFGGISLIYRAIHGEEDKKDPLNPADQENLVENYLNIFS